MLPLFQHQIEDIEFILKHPSVLNFSDAGTGKTRTAIEAIRARKHEGRTLVLCPKSIMYPAWGADIYKFAPELSYSIADATKRFRAFQSPTNIVIMNHDGVTAIEKELKRNPKFLDEFCQLIIDESTAYKNNCQRSQAAVKLSQKFKYRILLTGTPYTNTLCDLWRQAYLADGGQRLGPSFYRFRDQVCNSRTLGNGITIWRDKPNMEPIIYHLLHDITLRHKLEDCIDIPENQTIIREFTLPPSHQHQYTTMEHTCLLELQNGTITAANAAVLANKLLQIASGAVYQSNGQYNLLDTERHELIAEIAQEYPQVLIAFNWRHQKEELLKLLPNAEVIDGEVPTSKRNELVKRFQNKEIPQLLIHPKSGAHGLTLTAGYATIWASPTYSSEEFLQFNRRIYRAGQTKRTQTILIQAKNTIDETVYAKLNGKLDKAQLLSELFTQIKNP
jgi:SNF2 family DNA or RNA helicase